MAGWCGEWTLLSLLSLPGGLALWNQNASVALQNILRGLVLVWPNVSVDRDATNLEISL